jgi:hypothetical protein
VAKCLEFDPARRYAHARDLAEDLRRYLENLPMKHCPEPSFRERMGKFARRHPGLCGSTSIALISLILVGAALVAGFAVLPEILARSQRRVFNSNFTETRFLLSTTSASDQYLTKGIKEAGECFQYLGMDEEHLVPSAGWTRLLSDREKERLREQVVELILLEARAQIRLAEKSGSEDDRRPDPAVDLSRLDPPRHRTADTWRSCRSGRGAEKSP